MSNVGEQTMFNNICEGCPAAIALKFRRKQLAENPDSSISERRLLMQANEVNEAAMAFDRAAGKIGCKHIEKVLPAEPEIIPAVGSKALIEYVSKCPSFPTYMKLRTG